MFIILNLILILLIIRISFNKKILEKMMKYHWKLLVRFQHLFFAFVFILITFFTENYFLQGSDFIFSIILNGIFNIALYYFIYQYLVPHFYLSNKYPEFILFATVCFLVSSLFRILIGTSVFSIDLTNNRDNMIFFYNVYVSQAIVILMASFLGITKDKFIIEQDVIELGEENDQLYLNLLKSKLNPHFLLNTLNNIYANSFTPSPQTSESVLQLSKLLQYIIYDSGKEKISVSREFSSIYSLAGLYQLKYNDKLNITFDIKDENILELMEIPPSLFLTFFENALKHSEIGLETDRFIKVHCQVEGYFLCFEIINSLPAIKQSNVETGYHGLGNEAVVRILEKNFPNRFEFVSEPFEMNYRTTLKIKMNG